MISLSCGAVILTLAYVVFDIGSAGQLGVVGSDGISAVNPLAVLADPLHVAGQLLKGLGHALLLLPVLTTSPQLTVAAPPALSPKPDSVMA